MAYISRNSQTNEAISKYKLMSSYGGVGSVVHTQYGSVMITCFDDWPFIRFIIEKYEEDLGAYNGDGQMLQEFFKHKLNSKWDIDLSNDKRFKDLVKSRLGLNNLVSLVVIPDNGLSFYNEIETRNRPTDIEKLTISSVYFPKMFSDEKDHIKDYNEWRELWKDSLGDLKKYNLGDIKYFSPPKKILRDEDGNIRLFPDQNPMTKILQQLNLVLICENGHVSDIPWSSFLNWKWQNPRQPKETIDLFAVHECCDYHDVKMSSARGSAGGYDDMRLSCANEKCKKSASLKGIFNLSVKCQGHRPWRTITHGRSLISYYGVDNARINANGQFEPCEKNMRVAIITGNNLYYARSISSLYIPEQLLVEYDPDMLQRMERQWTNQIEFQGPNASRDEFIGIFCNNPQNGGHARLTETVGEFRRKHPMPGDANAPRNGVPQEINLERIKLDYRYEEYNTFMNFDEHIINSYSEDLKVKEVIANLDNDAILRGYFNKVLRLDNLKMSTTQVDFTRVEAYVQGQDRTPQRIYGCPPDNVLFYPVVENFGEGIFISFNDEKLNEFINELINRDENGRIPNKSFYDTYRRYFGRNAQGFAGRMIEKVNHDQRKGLKLMIIHSFSHLLMRELEFSCGYPVASLSERLYISEQGNTNMSGLMIFTAEGAEGSMGGLISQTNDDGLSKLIRSALVRAQMCPSDPMCWESQGQGLFELNLASCFSCGLVSETSCEEWNVYLDRRILADPDHGLFGSVVREELGII